MIDFFKKEREDAANERKEGLIIRRVDHEKARPIVMIWREGRMRKPFVHYSFSNQETREGYIQDIVDREISRKARKEAERARRKAERGSAVVKPGQIFWTSWGYDQTNYDYIVVLEVSKTGKTCICQRTDHLDVGNTMTADEQLPVNCPFGDKFRMRVDAGPVLIGSYPYAYDGFADRCGKRLDRFMPHENGRTFHETNPYFGH